MSDNIVRGLFPRHEPATANEARQLAQAARSAAEHHFLQAIVAAAHAHALVFGPLEAANKLKAIADEVMKLPPAPHIGRES